MSSTCRRNAPVNSAVIQKKPSTLSELGAFLMFVSLGLFENLERIAFFLEPFDGLG